MANEDVIVLCSKGAVQAMFSHVCSKHLIVTPFRSDLQESHRIYYFFFLRPAHCHIHEQISLARVVATARSAKNSQGHNQGDINTSSQPMFTPSESCSEATMGDFLPISKPVCLWITVAIIWNPQSTEPAFR